jgi:DNA-binding CsgD family transcriptional regulator
VLDRIGRPVAVVDETMRLRYANAPAHAVFERGALRIASGRVGARGPDADDRLRSHVRGAVSPDARSGAVRAGRDAELFRVEPLRPSETGLSRPLAMIFGARPVLSVDPAALRAAYGLTPREAEVAALFARGLGVGEAAAELRRSVNTIKTEARAVYAKLGVRGASESALKIVSDFNL